MINIMISMPTSADACGLPTPATLRGTGASVSAAFIGLQAPATAHARGRVWATNGSVRGTHAWRDPIG